MASFRICRQLPKQLLKNILSLRLQYFQATLEHFPNNYHVCVMILRSVTLSQYLLSLSSRGGTGLPFSLSSWQSRPPKVLYVVVLTESLKRQAALTSISDKHEVYVLQSLFHFSNSWSCCSFDKQCCERHMNLFTSRESLLW